MNKTKLTLLALLIFATANIQGSGIFARAQQFFSSVINPLSQTEQLYAAIRTLNLTAVQGILRLHPEEANKTFISNSEGSKTPLLAICLEYNLRKNDSNDLNTLDQITRELLNAGASPTKQMAKNFPLKTPSSSPLQLAAVWHPRLFRLMLSHRYLAENPLNINDPKQPEPILSFSAKAILGDICFKVDKPAELARDKLRHLQAIKLLLVAGADTSQILSNQSEKIDTIVQQHEQNNVPLLLYKIITYPSIDVFLLKSKNQLNHNESLRVRYQATRHMLNMLRLPREGKNREQYEQELQNICTNFIEANNQEKKTVILAKKIITALTATTAAIGITSVAVAVARKFGLSALLSSTIQSLSARFAGRVTVPAGA